MDCSRQVSCVHGIFQARILEWVPFPPPVKLPDLGIQPASPVLAGGLFTTESPGKPIMSLMHKIKYVKLQGKPIIWKYKISKYF